MTFLKINESARLIAADTCVEVPRRVGEVSVESIGGSSVFVESFTRRGFEAETVWMLPTDLDGAIARLEGHGQAWSFTNGSLRSANGLLASVAGSVSPSASGGRLAVVGHTGYAEIGASSRWGHRLVNRMSKRGGWRPTDGYTVGGWVYLTTGTDGVSTSGWHFCALIGAVEWSVGDPNPAGVTQYLSDAGSPATAPAAGSHALGEVFALTEASPFFSVHGFSLGGGSAARQVQDVFAVPYQMTAAEVTAMHTLTRVGGLMAQGLPLHRSFPFVVVSGDLLEGEPIIARVMVSRVNYLGGKMDSTWRNNLRKLVLVIEEVEPVPIGTASALGSVVVGDDAPILPLFRARRPFIESTPIDDGDFVP